MNDSAVHVREWGRGDRIALLAHGLSTDSGSWWQLGPELARRGYHVLAPDLPGHGLGPRREEYRWEDMAEALASVPGEAGGGAPVELALGHSMGGRVLAAAIESGGLRPERVVFEDPAWSAGNEDIARGFLSRKAATDEILRAQYPSWPEEAREATLHGLKHWDTGTIDLVRYQPAYLPGPGIPRALIVLADPSPVVRPEVAAELTAHGHTVRTVAGTGHIIHNDDFEGFLDALRDRL